MIGPGTTKRRVTLAQIAREADVSVGLVSAFLSGRSYGNREGSGIRIGQDTAERIVAICRKLEYQPDRSRTFRMIYPERAPIGIVGSSNDRFQSNRYTSMILDGVIGETTRNSLNLTVLQYDPEADYEAHPELVPDWVGNGEILRFIVAGPPNAALLAALVAQGADVVYASRDPGVEGVSVVVPDYAGASSIAIRYLRGLGHRVVGLFGLPYFHGTYQARELTKGARRVVSEMQLKERTCLMSREQRDSHRAPDIAIEQFLTEPDPVTAVFAFDDLSAESILAAAIRRGLRIPGQLSIIGCNDERQAALLNPPLSTVHFPITDIGQQAVQLLQDRALQRQPLPAEHITLPVHLVERASTARP